MAKIPKIHLFPLLVEEPSAGVDVDVVKIKRGGNYANKDDNEDHFYDPITKDVSNNNSVSFNHDTLKSKETTAKMIKSSHINETSPRTKHKNYLK